MHTTHFYTNLDRDDGVVARCLDMIERHAPRLMIAGGGGLQQELLYSGRRMSPATRESINAALVAGNGAGIRRIALDHGVSQAAVSKMWKKLRGAAA